VDSCQFWGNNQVCNAEEIWVRNDISGDPGQFKDHFINASTLDVEFATELGSKKKDHSINQNALAKTSPQTCCDTMKPKS
jgi:hypothetical protein